MLNGARLFVAAGIVCTATACATLGRSDKLGQVEPERATVIARAQVWRPTDVSRMNLRSGPRRRDGFKLGQIVQCTYLDEDLSGMSPKFACRVGANDDLKVKYGGTNGEVYGEVLASRLLWALGFGADAMYSVRVICRGCPREFGGILRPDERYLFDPVAIERKAPYPEIKPADREGWSWPELDLIDEERGGAPRAHQDALKLLAAFIQHSDTKPVQQRLVCLDARDSRAECKRPFMMLSDLGLTFGRANFTNANAAGSTNLHEWANTPVWKDESGCTANLAKSFSGTLKHPVISEHGRRFLAGLMTQLSDEQLTDLFEAARVSLRPRMPARARSGFATVQEWVDAFKAKRSQIVTRKCA
jgi:hypothetical protein